MCPSVTSQLEHAQQHICFKAQTGCQERFFLHLDQQGQPAVWRRDPDCKMMFFRQILKMIGSCSHNRYFIIQLIIPENSVCPSDFAMQPFPTSIFQKALTLLCVPEELQPHFSLFCTCNLVLLSSTQIAPELEPQPTWVRASSRDRAPLFKTHYLH